MCRRGKRYKNEGWRWIYVLYQGDVCDGKGLGSQYLRLGEI